MLKSSKDRRDCARAERGFTLIETSIALCVMMVVGLGVISLFLYAANYGSGASDRARAMAVAQERMEKARSMDYAALANLDTNADFNGKVTVGSKTAGESDARTFTVVTTVVNDPNTGATARQKRVTITVTPATPQAWAGSVSLQMSRSQNALGAN